MSFSRWLQRVLAQSPQVQPIDHSLHAGKTSPQVWRAASAVIEIHDPAVAENIDSNLNKCPNSAIKIRLSYEREKIKLRATRSRGKE